MRFERTCLGAAVALVVLSHASTAWAGGWALPVSGGTPTLGFGVAYASGTHRGVDLQAAAGSEVVAPADGTVTFAGRVPADGGGTCGAVTIELTDGHRVSLLPLEGMGVAAGESVAAADVLGSLAAGGDDSSTVPHLHVGLRSGELYLDPTPFLPGSGTAAESPVLETTVVPVSEPPVVTSADAAAAPPVVSAALAAVVSVPSPSSPPNAVQAEVVQPAPAADAAAQVTADPVAANARASVGQAATPNNARHTVRPGIRTLSFSARPVTSGILALGMLATGIAIVRVRRASPVHVR